MTVLSPERRLYCPNCGLQEIDRGPMPIGQVAQRFHPCPALKGIAAPLVVAGTKCKVEAHERDDYIGSDIVTVDGEDRPIMSIVTTRDDGTDCVVFAPCATARFG